MEWHSATGPVALFQILQAALLEYQISLLLHAKEQCFKTQEMSEEMLCCLLSEGCFTLWNAEAQAKGALSGVQSAQSGTLQPAAQTVQQGAYSSRELSSLVAVVALLQVPSSLVDWAAPPSNTGP